jgi:hypothetical protein
VKDPVYARANQAFGIGLVACFMIAVLAAQPPIRVLERENVIVHDVNPPRYPCGVRWIVAVPTGKVEKCPPLHDQLCQFKGCQTKNGGIDREYKLQLDGGGSTAVIVSVHEDASK